MFSEIIFQYTFYVSHKCVAPMLTFTNILRLTTAVFVVLHHQMKLVKLSIQSFWTGENGRCLSACNKHDKLALVYLLWLCFGTSWCQLLWPNRLSQAWRLWVFMIWFLSDTSSKCLLYSRASLSGALHCCTQPCSSVFLYLCCSPSVGRFWFLLLCIKTYIWHFCILSAFGSKFCSSHHSRFWNQPFGISWFAILEPTSSIGQVIPHLLIHGHGSVYGRLWVSTATIPFPEATGHCFLDPRPSSPLPCCLEVCLTFPVTHSPMQPSAGQ